MILDAYGCPSRTDRRHPLCRCPVPCAGRFDCMSAHHVGRRATPWCCGCGDALQDEVDLCDECWCKQREIDVRGAEETRDG